MIYTINLILGGGTEVRRCDAENQINFNKDREKKNKRNVLVAGIEQLSGTVYSSLYTEGSKIMGAVHGSYFPKELARLLIISY